MRENRERLSKEPEQEKERVDKLEADLGCERLKGFWSRLFSR